MDILSTYPVGKLLHCAGAGELYLSRYNPDFNPIDKPWSKVKAVLRKLFLM